MCPNLRLVLVLGILVLALTTTSTEARRRRQIDSPIENAADAPLEDNLATASGIEETRSDEEPVSIAIETINAPQQKAATSVAECGAENISYELVTG
jgi:hypothetical protein